MKVSGSAWLAALLFLATALPAAAQLPSVDLSQPINADRAVRLALERNYSIRLAEDRLGLERANRTAAYGEFFPSLTATYDYTHSRSVNNNGTTGLFAPFPSEVDERGYTINANHTLLSVSALLRIAAAKRNVGASEAEVRDAEQLAAFGVRRQYYLLIEAIKLLDVRREDLRLAGEEQRRTESLFEVGSVARTDVLKARVRVSEAQSTLITAENNTQLERARLAQALALPPESVVNVEENLEPRSQEQSVDSLQAYSVALENRQDLRAARMRVSAASSDRKSALARKLPYLTHSYNRSFGRSTGDQRIITTEGEFPDITLRADTTFARATSSFWSYRIGFTWNILDNLVTVSNVQRARSQQLTAEHEAEDLAIQVALDVKEALLALRAARAQVQSAREGLASAQEDLNLSQERYTVGLGTILELIDAQVALTRARTAEVQAMASEKIAEAQLDRATGRVTW